MKTNFDGNGGVSSGARAASPERNMSTAMASVRWSTAERPKAPPSRRVNLGAI
jgi:hypothetical protein